MTFRALLSELFGILGLLLEEEECTGSAAERF